MVRERVAVANHLQTVYCTVAYCKHSFSNYIDSFLPNLTALLVLCLPLQLKRARPLEHSGSSQRRSLSAQATHHQKIQQKPLLGRFNLTAYLLLLHRVRLSLRHTPAARSLIQRTLSMSVKEKQLVLCIGIPVRSMPYLHACVIYFFTEKRTVDVVLSSDSSDDSDEDAETSTQQSKGKSGKFRA